LFIFQFWLYCNIANGCTHRNKCTTHCIEGLFATGLFFGVAKDFSKHAIFAQAALNTRKIPKRAFAVCVSLFQRQNQNKK
jgi:hypothetical protein